MKENIEQQLKDIKKSFRLVMNGVASKSMRDKGSEYKVNWGVSLPLLKEMALEIGKNYDLAIALWKEDIRECKILATLLMPVDKMQPEIADIWIEQTKSQEMAEIASFYLYQNLPFAFSKAFEWIAYTEEIPQICAYQVLARLYMRGIVPNEQCEKEFLNRVCTALQSKYSSVRHAAFVSVQKFITLGEIYEDHAKSVFKSINLQLF
jgi:hypothetical protein